MHGNEDYELTFLNKSYILWEWDSERASPHMEEEKRSVGTPLIFPDFTAIN